MKKLYFKRFKLEFKNDLAKINIMEIGDIEKVKIEKEENVFHVTPDYINTIITGEYLIIKYTVVFR